MKRRWILATATFSLYVVLLAIVWIVGTRQAVRKTENLLDYAITDFRDTINGALDTMLGYAANAAVRYFGKAEPHSVEEMTELVHRLDMDELNLVDRMGNIVATSDPASVGKTMTAKRDSADFMVLTNGTQNTYSQPFRASVYDANARRKYLGFAFPGGDGFVQIGLDEKHLVAMLPTMLLYIFDEWLLGEKGFFLCADVQTGKLISNPSRHRDMAKTLAETGYREEEAKQYEFSGNDFNGVTFVQHLFGEMCYCRNYVFAGHHIIAALPAREFYDTRMVFVSVFAVLLFVVLFAFGWFIDRILCDAERLKAFYEAEEESLAKELAIAKNIQASALPTDLPDNPRFRLCAAMTPAREVGGDFYDFFPLDENRVAFLVADVSGKGITAALYMMTAKTLIKNALLSSQNPASALVQANSELCRNNTANMFLTAWVGVLDLTSGTVSFANAGHNPPVLLNGFSPETDPASRKASYLNEKSGCVLAIMDDIPYKERHVRLLPGDALFLYTDGVTEAMDSKGGLFGEDRLREALLAAPSAIPSTVCNVVRMAVSAFAAGEPQADDITFLAIEYRAGIVGSRQ